MILGTADCVSFKLDVSEGRISNLVKSSNRVVRFASLEEISSCSWFLQLIRLLKGVLIDFLFQPLFEII